MKYNLQSHTVFDALVNSFFIKKFKKKTTTNDSLQMIIKSFLIQFFFIRFGTIFTSKVYIFKNPN